MLSYDQINSVLAKQAKSDLHLAKQDKIFLARAFKLARRGRFTTSPNPNVGCVIVQRGRIVGEGYHKHAGGPHAEVQALSQAREKAHNSTVYVTLEPCSHYGRTPPCVDALINAGIKRVVAAMLDPHKKVAGQGFFRLKEAGIDVRYGFMLQVAEEINLGFLKRARTGLPWIRLKLASSLDGRTAIANGESQWITSPESRQDVQIWRAESDAILSSASTILIDNPALTVRWSSLPKKVQALCSAKKTCQPVRVVIDSANRVTPTHRVAQEPGELWLARLFLDNLSWPMSVKQLKLPSYLGENRLYLDLMALITELGTRQINMLWIEAGATLSGALINTGLIDELIVYQAPKLLGADARPLCSLFGVRTLDTAPTFTLLDIQKIGPDIRLRFKPNKRTYRND